MENIFTQAKKELKKILDKNAFDSSDKKLLRSAWDLAEYLDYDKSTASEWIKSLEYGKQEDMLWSKKGAVSNFDFISWLHTLVIAKKENAKVDHRDFPGSRLFGYLVNGVPKACYTSALKDWKTKIDKNSVWDASNPVEKEIGDLLRKTPLEVASLMVSAQGRRDLIES